jgi:hypothetical protein
VAAIAVVIAAALVAIGLLGPAPARPPAPDPVVVPVSRAGMGCLIYASWAPNGKQIAALMTPNTCTQSSGSTSLVLYDASLTHPGTPIALDHAILLQGLPQSVQQDPALMQQAGVAYYNLRWSPDSSRVAVLAGGPVPSAPSDTSGQSQYFWALAVVDVQSEAMRVIATPPQPNTAFSGNNSPYNPDSYQSALAWRFDLTVGTSAFASIPQALAYSWNADGSLTPSVPLPAANGTPAALLAAGSPWQSFSINQVVDICGISDYEVMLSASLWSPDGRYVVPAMYAHGRLANAPTSAPTATPQDSGDGGTNGCSPQTPPRDAAQLAPLLAPPAVAQAVNQVAQPSDTGSSGAGPLDLYGLLSPTNNRLAVQLQGQEYLPWVARIYDVKSGALRATITQQTMGATYTGKTTAAMAWSPDGAHLLLWNDHAFYLLGARSLGG